MKQFAIATAALLPILAGCVSTARYEPPRPPAGQAVNSITVNRPRIEVWKSAVPALAKSFVVINNIDQSSGLINLSYGGDPEQYVDCGMIGIDSPGGNQEYFPAARASHTFLWNAGLVLLRVTRTVALEGRVNLIFEDLGPQTRVTVNTRYMLTRSMNAYRAEGGIFSTTSATIAFNTGQQGYFTPTSSDGQTITCNATGHLEGQILEAAAR